MDSIIIKSHRREGNPTPTSPSGGGGGGGQKIKSVLRVQGLFLLQKCLNVQQWLQSASKLLTIGVTIPCFVQGAQMWSRVTGNWTITVEDVFLLPVL